MTESMSIAESFKSQNPKEWSEIGKLYRLLKIRQFLISSSVALIILAVASFFYFEENNLEIALIPFVISVSFIYLFLFRLKKASEIYDSISSVFIPALFYLLKWNIEYQLSQKPYLEEFKKSRLYPFSLTKIQGTHYMSGIAKQIPFIAWFVEASYRSKVGESPLSQVSTTSEVNGFYGFQIIVKNLNSGLYGFIAHSKSDDETLLSAMKYFEANPKWKRLKGATKTIEQNFGIFTPKANPEEVSRNALNEKLLKLSKVSTKPFSISFRKNSIYLNLYWDDELCKVDTKKSLNENVDQWAEDLNEIVNIAFVLGVPF